MSNKPRKTFGGTRKKYTVQFSAFDPPQPVYLRHTNNLKTAQRLFDEVKEIQQELGPSGEWMLTLHEHNEHTDFDVHKTDDGDMYADHPFVYGVIFKTSKLVDEFSYMDVSWHGL